MPNHTTTRLTVTGSNEELEEFIQDVKGKTNLDFEKVWPMPAHLRYTISPTTIISDELSTLLWQSWSSKKRLGHLKEDELVPRIGLTKHQYDVLMEKYGYSNWYDWCIGNWSTKWNAYEVSQWCKTNQKAWIEYETASYPATNFYLNVSKQYPSLTFKHEFVDEGGDYAGYEIIIMGNIVDEEDYVWEGEACTSLRKSLNIYHELFEFKS